MNFSRHLFLTLSLAVALGSAIAQEIPGYVGIQSFRLIDDPQLRDLERQTDDAKVNVARIDQVRAQLSDQVESLLGQRDNVVAHMNDLERKINEAKSLKASLQSKLDELNKTPEANADQITQIKNQLNSQDQLIADLSRQYGASKLDLAPLNVRIDQLQHDLSIATANTQNAMARLQSLSRDRDLYRQSLIYDISMINREGANRGRVDGSSDGALLSRRLGQDLGSRDGNNDGLNQGTIDGQNRYYQQGADVGEKEGSERARLDGQRDGTKEGTRDGNISAGAREGNLAGIKRAQGSNAASVGITQGKKAGMERAIQTGAINGNNKGEEETVKKYESGELNSITVNGPFAGSFQRRSPDYPGDFNGPNFNSNVYNNRDLLRRAYADGYVDQYRDYTRYEYLRLIDADYNRAYDNSYASAYNQAANREYPDYFERGRREADAKAYSRDYPVVKASAYKVAFENADTNPSRSSDDFKVSYKNSELAAFNERYEQIRRANFDVAEADTFNANIAAQTEIYRQKRIGEVSTVYNNNAILAFVSSEMFDGGINGVAKLDGVFQPGETTLHSIILQNFGMKAAVNVSVVLDNGEAVRLPEIPARSLVKISGAGKSQIATNATIGSTVKTSLKVISKLTSDDAVEGLHFDSIGSGVLKNSDVKAVRVFYPLALSNLALSSQLIKGVKNNLNIAVTNNSKRAYAGELSVQVLVNSQSEVLTKPFGKISALQNTAQLTDAEVLVTDEKDIYRDLDFSATISQNGVTLGVLSSDLVAMAKAPYIEKSKAPVIIANSDKNLNQLLDALALLGGTENASVLDLSLSSLNAGTIAKGLDQKVILVTDDEKGSNISSLNTFLAKSKSSTFVFIDEYASGLRNALNLPSSKDAQSLLWDKRTVVFTNPYRADGVVKSSAMIQSTLTNFDKDLILASDLAQGAQDLLARIKSEVNRTSYFTSSNTLKVFSLKALSEILCISKAYTESGGIFTRDSKWPNMIENDGGLFLNTLRMASSGEVNEAKLGVVLSSIAMRDSVLGAIEGTAWFAKDMKMKMRSTVTKVMGKLEDDLKNNLKKFDNNLYNKAHDQASIHRPFAISLPSYSH